MTLFFTSYTSLPAGTTLDYLDYPCPRNSCTLPLEPHVSLPKMANYRRSMVADTPAHSAHLHLEPHASLPENGKLPRLLLYLTYAMLLSTAPRTPISLEPHALQPSLAHCRRSASLPTTLYRRPTPIVAAPPAYQSPGLSLASVLPHSPDPAGGGGCCQLRRRGRRHSQQYSHSCFGPQIKVRVYG